MADNSLIMNGGAEVSVSVDQQTAGLNHPRLKPGFQMHRRSPDAGQGISHHSTRPGCRNKVEGMFSLGYADCIGHQCPADQFKVEVSGVKVFRRRYFRRDEISDSAPTYFACSASVIFCE